MNHNISAAVMYPKPYQKPRMPILIGGYVDKVLQRAATAGDGWLTYFYRPADFKKSWDKIRGFAKEAGKDPNSLLNAAQLPIMVGASKEADAKHDGLAEQGVRLPAHSDCSRESAITGTVDDCVAQLRDNSPLACRGFLFVPYKYRADQVETIAREIIPQLKSL